MLAGTILSCFGLVTFGLIIYIDNKTWFITIACISRLIMGIVNIIKTIW
jgi:hypothetical protein